MRCGAERRAFRAIARTSAILTRSDVRVWFESYATGGAVDLTQGRVTAQLSLAAGFFQRLDLFAAVAPLDTDKLFVIFGSDGLRRAVKVIGHLCKIGVVHWDQTRFQDLTERRRIDELLHRHSRRSWSFDVRAFLSAQERRELRPKTMRQYLQAATSLLMASKRDRARELTQGDLDRFIQRKPGQRASITSFVGWLQTMRLVMLHVSAKPFKDEIRREKLLIFEVRALVVGVTSRSTVAATRRALLAALLARLYLLPLSEVVKLRRQDWIMDGRSAVLWPDTHRILLHGQVACAFIEVANSAIGFVFPGFGGYRPCSTDVVRYHRDKLLRAKRLSRAA